MEELQELDQTIALKKLEQQNISAEIDLLQRSLTEAQNALATRQDQLSDLQQQRKELDAALHTEQENIKRSETNMKEIKTNKEFQAVGREITTARKQVAEIEEEQASLDSQIALLVEAIEASQQEFDRLSRDITDENQEKQTLLDTIQAVINDTISRRDAAQQGLPATLLRRYNQLREQRHGLALGLVREGSCCGCNMQLPPQLYNILFKGEELHFCPHCQRILVLKVEQQLKAA